jgi:hypothetical protein
MRLTPLASSMVTALHFEEAEHAQRGLRWAEPEHFLVSDAAPCYRNDDHYLEETA